MIKCGLLFIASKPKTFTCNIKTESYFFHNSTGLDSRVFDFVASELDAAAEHLRRRRHHRGPRQGQEPVRQQLPEAGPASFRGSSGRRRAKSGSADKRRGNNLEFLFKDL